MSSRVRNARTSALSRSFDSDHQAQDKNDLQIHSCLRGRGARMPLRRCLSGFRPVQYLLRSHRNLLDVSTNSATHGIAAPATYSAGRLCGQSFCTCLPRTLGAGLAPHAQRPHGMCRPKVYEAVSSDANRHRPLISGATPIRRTPFRHVSICRHAPLLCAVSRT